MSTCSLWGSVLVYFTLNGLISITFKKHFYRFKFFFKIGIFFQAVFQSLKSHLNANFYLVCLRTVIFLYTVTTQTCLVKGFTCLVLKVQISRPRLQRFYLAFGIQICIFFSFKFFFFFYKDVFILFILAAALSLWDLPSLATCLAVKAWSPNHWTIRECPSFKFFL